MSGPWTGYAYGNLQGAAGVEVVQGHFANHSSTRCPTDPAASWPFDTFIYPTSPTTSVTLYDQSGTPVLWGGFTLEDVGDFSCALGSYWADIYFGRYDTDPSNSASCDCNNGGGDVCYYGVHRNCPDAVNWGNRSYTYGYYFP